ncbi:MAG: bifunctional oligoribonuclease/PAP phosphatase NrnA [Chloroflexi bacterium]|nr:bifunctional oligoribonuclease/PAP phosphatase NrnA [Chloroflexota bacterium]
MAARLDQPAPSQLSTPLITAHEHLFDVLTAHRDERHIIVLHAYPDPDAISAAYAHRLISAQCHIETDIVYCGTISHSQNIALTRLLKLDLAPYDPTRDLSQYQGAVYVDHQGTTCNALVEALETAGVPALIVVDHHEAQGRLQPAFSDVRRTGATATIYAEYLEGGPLKLDQANPDHVAVATALMHGLMTDTANFVRANAEDFHAAAYLSQFSDANLLSQIMSQSRSKPTLEIISRALACRTIVANFSIAGVGYLRGENRDAIPQTADFLLSEENVHTAIVYGIVTDDNGEENLIGSLRTSKLVLDPDQFIKDVLGKDTGGRYFGGGKQAAGGFQIPIGFLAGSGRDEYADLKWQVFDAQVRHKLLGKIEAEHGTR